MMPKYADRNKLVIYIILAVITAAGLLYTFVPGSFPSKYEHDIITLDEGWNISYDDENRSDISLSEAAIPVADSGDTFFLMRKLKDYGIKSACLQIKTIHASFQVYLDDELIFDYASDLLKAHRIIPMGNVYVPLPDNYPGRTLTIKYTAGQDSAFAGFDNIYLGLRKDLLSMRSDVMRLQFYVGIFLLSLGITISALTPYLIFNKADYARVFLGSLISVILGIYILTTSDIFNYFTSKMIVNTILEYASFYSVPAALCAYISCIMPNGKLKILFKYITIIDLIAYIYCIVAHFTGIALFSTHTMMFHILCGIQAPLALISAIYFLYTSRDKKRSDPDVISFQILMIGISVFLICAMIEIILFNVLKFSSPRGESTLNLDFLTFGSLIFVLFIFIGYFEYQIYSIESLNRQQFLSGLAYYDPLTGLSNRARCQEEMLTAGNDGRSYVIISIDLDNLKTINDTYGHDSGDKYLSLFSDMLSSSFRFSDITGRMGGDEFIVILYEQSLVDANSRMIELQNKFARTHFGQSGITYGFSYGIASDLEFPGQDAEKIYTIADIRMYEMKRQRHQNVKAKESPKTI
ncbi:MAG: GGDEF domain-containing protein [Butyrivibrio sp.]|uniref:GGDEF domain-containing protein n=1 Tax=Butyrivibrio sp. TaxID=28121 RepID=UPI0025FE769A|nr:GGDEF domain-containing protein [Butyrivibrio sp.]MCR5770812.1 GGDEF domain-containing protein [Butyrivibrio sp.]